MKYKYKKKPNTGNGEAKENTGPSFCRDEKKGNIHYRDCPHIDDIMPSRRIYTDKYDPDAHQCPECGIKAYVAAYAKDPENIDKYVKFYSKMGVTPGDVRYIYVNLGFETKIRDGELYVTYKTDSWKIVPRLEKKRVTLYHNSYSIVNGDRVFNGDYHIQNTTSEDLELMEAIVFIKRYEYRPKTHDATKSSNKKTKEEKERLYIADGNYQILWRDTVEDGKPAVKYYFAPVIKDKNKVTWPVLNLRESYDSLDEALIDFYGKYSPDVDIPNIII